LKEFKVFDQNLSEENEGLITEAIRSFDSIEGGFGKRNFIKHMNIEGIKLNIKSFKIPNLINKIAYKFFRKSKARRSFEFAKRLLKLGIDTPKPIAFFEYSTSVSFDKSYYVSEQLEYELTYRELIHDHDYPDFEEILRAFTRFTFKLHESEVNFLDHSPGNTLIKKNEKTNEYEFYLVDLNRMKFKSLNFEERMKNFAKLSPKDIMLEIMSDEYAKLYTLKTKDDITNMMYHYSHKFSTYYVRQEQFKKKYYFWRK
jgi:hypothetical protein